MKRKMWTDTAMWAGFYILWILLFRNGAFTFSRTATVGFCYLLFIAGNFYYNIYFTIPRFLYRKRYAIFALLLLAGIAAAALMRVPLAWYLSTHYFRPTEPAQPFLRVYTDSFINIFIWTACFLAAKLILDRIRFQKYVDEIEKERSRTELEFLKAQFNPHFLFNSINSIYGHIDKGNPTARHMLLTFSDMLRYQLYECNSDQISIDKEISYIRNYIALQQARKGEQLIVNFDVADGVCGFAIVPLLFIAFVENAFKYVSNYDDSPNVVSISFSRNDDTLVFETSNTIEPNYKNAIQHKGIGIANVKRRLELLYPERYRLDIHESEDTYTVRLELKIL